MDGPKEGWWCFEETWKYGISGFVNLPYVIVREIPEVWDGNEMQPECMRVSIF